MIRQKLRGLVGQAISGGRKTLTPLSLVYAPGSYTFRPTRPGWYRFVLWGPGGTTGAAVSSGGALVIAQRVLSVGQSVAIVVGNAGANSTITLPSGEVLTAGAGQEGASLAGGVASGNRQLGDILVNGNASTASPGAGASYGPYIGGAAGSEGSSPGGGGQSGLSGFGGGDGLCVIHQVRMRP